MMNLTASTTALSSIKLQAKELEASSVEAQLLYECAVSLCDTNTDEVFEVKSEDLYYFISINEGDISLVAEYCYEDYDTGYLEEQEYEIIINENDLSLLDKIDNFVYDVQCRFATDTDIDAYEMIDYDIDVNEVLESYEYYNQDRHDELLSIEY